MTTTTTKPTTKRRTDLCTCGQPRESSVHTGPFDASVPGAPLHPFTPNPQPGPLPAPAAFNRILATRVNGTWVATVFDGPKSEGKIGTGQAQQWRDAVDAAIEDLREKQEKAP